MAYGAYKDLQIGAASQKVLCGKEFADAGNPSYNQYQWVTSMVFDIFFYKKSKDTIIFKDQK